MVFTLIKLLLWACECVLVGLRVLVIGTDCTVNIPHALTFWYREGHSGEKKVDSEDTSAMHVYNLYLQLSAFKWTSTPVDICFGPPQPECIICFKLITWREEDFLVLGLLFFFYPCHNNIILASSWGSAVASHHFLSRQRSLAPFLLISSGGDLACCSCAPSIKL